MRYGNRDDIDRVDKILFAGASPDSLVWLLRTIGFIDALVSVLTLQNTLIMVHSNGEDLGMLPLSAMTSALVWAAVLILSTIAILQGIRRIKK